MNSWAFGVLGYYEYCCHEHTFIALVFIFLGYILKSGIAELLGNHV